jgi:hypothetical protein
MDEVTKKIEEGNSTNIGLRSRIDKIVDMLAKSWPCLADCGGDEPAAQEVQPLLHKDMDRQ